MNISLSRIEVEMLRILQQKDSRYKKGLVEKIRNDLKSDYDSLKR
jgi:hypothetical protein